MSAAAMVLVAAGLCVSGCQDAVPARISVDGAAFEVRTLEVDEGAEGSALGASDLDGDGHLDVVASTGGGSLRVLRGDGLGGLALGARVPAGQYPSEIFVTDVDGDGNADIVAANHETRHLTLLAGDGQGGFAPGRTIEVDVSPHVHVVLARDVDGDGIIDLVVDDRDGEGILVLRGEGAGRFASGTLFDGGGDPYRGMAAGDLDGDGQLDFVTPNPREVGVLLSGGRVPYELRRGTPVPGTVPFAVALADLDADGHLDLVAASGEGADRVWLYRGDGAGGFREMDLSPVRSVSGPKRIVTGDFDGDGVTDAAVGGWGSAAVTFLFGGDGGPRAATVAGATDGDRNSWGLFAADLNEDGRDDLIVADGHGPLLTLFLSTEETP